MSKQILCVLALLYFTGCGNMSFKTPVTVLLGSTHNINMKCAGHAEHLCGTEDEMLPTEIAGLFATEPTCQGIRLRGLNEQERQTPSNQLPLLLDVFYEGTPHVARISAGSRLNSVERTYFARDTAEKELVRPAG